MDEGPISIMKPYIGCKVHSIRFQTKIRSENTKTYSCDVVIKGTGERDTSVIDYYGVLKEGSAESRVPQ